MNDVDCKSQKLFICEAENNKCKTFFLPDTHNYTKLMYFQICAFLTIKKVAKKNPQF